VSTEAPKNTEKILFLLKIEGAERPRHGLTTTEGSQTANLCIAHGLTATEADETASTSNGQILNLKIVIATVTVWPWIELRVDHQVCRLFAMTSVWSVGYKYPSISCKIALLAIWTAYLTLESPLPSHTSFPWSIVGVWDPSAWFEWFELCGTRDSSNKHHPLVTLGGCHLLEGLEEWKLWALQEDCEGDPVFLWEVLSSPRGSGVEQL
jgi:hypothetical protein